MKPAAVEVSMAEQERDPAHPETEAAKRSQQRTGDSPSEELAGEDRFTADEGTGERGYRGQKGEDTPPGAVPGGSYGGGGGVQQGGFERSTLDDVEESASPEGGSTKQ
jgi:hypothetical protein